MIFETTILALGTMAGLMLVQIIVADFIGIKSKHIPGTTVTSDHDNVLFRATRTVANTNESIAIFVLLVLFCILSNANPVYTGYAAWGFVATRVAYALCYYADLRLPRSIIFGVSVIFLLALLVIGLAVYL